MNLRKKITATFLCALMIAMIFSATGTAAKQDFKEPMGMRPGLETAVDLNHNQHKVWYEYVPDSGTYEIFYENNKGAGVQGNMGVGNDKNPSTVMLSIHHLETNSIEPQIAVAENGEVIVTWIEQTEAGSRIYSVFTDDAGESWYVLGDITAFSVPEGALTDPTDPSNVVVVGPIGPSMSYDDYITTNPGIINGFDLKKELKDIYCLLERPSLPFDPVAGGDVSQYVNVGRDLIITPIYPIWYPDDCPEPTPPPPPEPDLKVVDIQFSQEYIFLGDTVTITAVVKNVGTAPIDGPFTVRFYEAADYLGKVTKSGTMPPGDTLNFDKSHTFTIAGKRTIYTDVSAKDDTNTGNNERYEYAYVLTNNGDYDGDGLTDYDEVYVYNTNPLNSDTDGDGMPDGWEVNYMPDLDPKVWDANGDPDGDGLTNLREYQYGTDPTDWDTDNDGLNDQYEYVMDKGVLFLQTHQSPNEPQPPEWVGDLHDGEFATYMWNLPDHSDEEYVFTIFTTPFVIHSLNYVGNLPLDSVGTPEYDNMVSSALSHFAPHEEDIDGHYGIYRFFGYEGVGEFAPPYDLPPDFCTTGTVNSALHENGISVNPDLVYFKDTYRAPNGAFYVWMRDNNEPTDICSTTVVNALYMYAILGAESQIPDTMDWLNDMLDNMMAGLPYFAEYYRSPYAFTYSATRAYADAGAQGFLDAAQIRDLQTYILLDQQADGSWPAYYPGNTEVDLETALALVSLLNLDYNSLTASEKAQVDLGIQYLLGHQNSDGSWDNAPFYTGGAQVLWYGSEEMTTAIALEALAKYSQI